MNLFVWTDSLATGNPFIDDDHRQLVLHVNAVLGAIAGKPADLALQDALHALLVFTRAHFAREEEQMQRIHFGKASHHTEEHQRLLAQLDGVCAQLAAGEPVEKMDLYHFLTWWVKDHIRLEDTQLAAALQTAH